MTATTGALPASAPGHWDTPSGHEMASEYLSRRREQLMKGDLSDLALANRVFLASRTDLDLIVWQTAAKERIRWLSAQLAALTAAPVDPIATGAEPHPSLVHRALCAIVRRFPCGGAHHEPAIRAGYDMGWRDRHELQLNREANP